ncbi:MAG: phospho-N-acetylmuramoyl-pentapeptide-transferase [Zetaproteobacteria bacterium]|nr:phospho-N-acetylmuramoyl-pentapeptide-transferase [Zetaproteobacteria bacterium]
MLYWLLYGFVDQVGALNVTRYLTFRMIVALLSALVISFLLSPWFIRKLKTKQMGQVVRDEGPKSHFSKAGTPTMGGGLILFAVALPTLLWMDLFNPYVWLSLAIFTGYGFLGFVDDYKKITQKNTAGVRGKQKMVIQVCLAVVVVAYALAQGWIDGVIHMPFFKHMVFSLGWGYVVFAAFVIVGASNAVNLTDGLDGLAIGPVMIAASCYAALAYITGHKEISQYLQFPFVLGVGELSIFAAAIFGASMGFLWYNAYPAQVFMGDIGSLPLGGALGALAVFSKHELLLAIIGGVFVLEAVSVITQVLSFKLTGKRVFRMAPIHHHFELKGWAEPKVIVRFWIISVVLALIGLLSLKVR